MKKILIAIGAAALLLGVLTAASGCGGTASAGGAQLSAEKFAQLEEGMTGDQIKGIAGEPSRKEQKNVSGGHQMSGMNMDQGMTVENWYYQGSKGWVRIEVSDGKLTGKSGY